MNNLNYLEMQQLRIEVASLIPNSKDEQHIIRKLTGLRKAPEGWVKIGKPDTNYYINCQNFLRSLSVEVFTKLTYDLFDAIIVCIQNSISYELDTGEKILLPREEAINVFFGNITRQFQLILGLFPQELDNLDPRILAEIKNHIDTCPALPN